MIALCHLSPGYISYFPPVSFRISSNVLEYVVQQYSPLNALEESLSHGVCAQTKPNKYSILSELEPTS